jgi:hypothetical protein
MKRYALAWLWLAALLFPVPGNEPAFPSRDMAAFLPELEGWSKDGSMEVFSPENLYEHINGAAENFLAYGFRRLVVQNYINGQKQSLCAEIYFHGSPENAFGIYGSEKPRAGDYFVIGSQGYGEEGVLNFIRDAYYVKLNSFDLGARGGVVLKTLAEKISLNIGGTTTLPEEVNAFPARGKIAKSERFIRSNFLGHEFLRSAFIADYDLHGRQFQLFILKPGSEDDARALLRRYVSLDKKNAAPEIRPGDLTVNDPYNGPVRLTWKGSFIWGSLGQGEEVESLLREMAANLAAKE